MHHRTFVAGEVIFRQGDPGASLYLIARGVVRITRKIDDDWRHIATLMAGNFFGEAAFLQNRPRNATVTAMTACSLYELSRNNLEAVLDVYPSIRQGLEKENERRQIRTTETGVGRELS
jgi:CPA1 family monovalent cation:H+ antiporter